MKRWPIILTGIIDTIYRADHDISVTLPSLAAGSTEEVEAQAKISEGKGIIEKISKLKYDMARDRPLEYVCYFVMPMLCQSKDYNRFWCFTRSIPADGEAWTEEYNDFLNQLAERKQNTWFTAPWLFAE